MKLKNVVTGVVVQVPIETADLLGPEWKPVPKPAKRKS